MNNTHIRPQEVSRDVNWSDRGIFEASAEQADVKVLKILPAVQVGSSYSYEIDVIRYDVRERVSIVFGSGRAKIFRQRADCLFICFRLCKGNCRWAEYRCQKHKPQKSHVIPLDEFDESSSATACLVLRSTISTTVDRQPARKGI